MLMIEGYNTIKARSSSALTEADSDMQLRGPSFAQWQREETPQGQRFWQESRL